MQSQPIAGPMLVGKHVDTISREFTDQGTNKTRTSRSFKVLVPYPDGSILPHDIYLPDNYRAPDLVAGEYYAYPVTIRPKRDGKGLSYTARPDLMPFEAPTAA